MSHIPFDPNITYVQPDHAPTIVDYMNALKYASNKIQKEICDENPDKYIWNEKLQTAYFCPDNLQCLQGKAAFTQKGCMNESTLNYEDCVRDKNGLCDYKSDKWNPPKGIDGGVVGKKKILEGKCSKNATKTCKKDLDCGDDGHCVIDFKPYLEWYDKDVKIGSHTYQGEKCYWVVDDFRKWCEMPWARTGKTKKSDVVVDKSTGKVKNEYKVTNVPPYYYDDTNGKCYTTKTYCNQFGNKFGKQKDYLLFSNCKETTDEIINTDKDCCVDLGTSIGQFFLGKTITECIKDPSKKGCFLVDRILEFFCDARLKKNVKLLKKNFLPGINIYLFEWNDVASKLYKLQGKSIGFMSHEIEQKYPALVQKDRYGYEFLKYDSSLCNRDKTFKKICVFMSNQKFINALINL